MGEFEDYIQRRLEEEAARITPAAGPLIGADVTKFAGYVPITDELWGDAAASRAWIDSLLHPWLYPDPNPMPRIVLFPRLDRLARRIGAARARLARARPDDWDDDFS